jgi:hypothetical protein
LAQLNATNPADTSAGDDFYRNLFKGLQKGKDVSTITAFQPMLEAGASQERMATEAGGYGDAGLVGATGTPEQKAVLGRQNEIAGERIKEGTGQAIADSIPGEVAAGTAYGEEAANEENQFNLDKFRTQTGAINANSHYTPSPWTSFLPGLVAGGAKAATMFV